MFIVSDTWKKAFPGAHAGILAMNGLTNPQHHAALEKRKQLLEDQLRQRFSSQDRSALASLEPVQAYTAFYKPFKKTYHVLLQLDSIVFKGKSIPNVAALVEAMFMAELENLLLTAGHDLDILQLPVKLEVSKGGEQYYRLNGQEQELKPGDMFMADRTGVISSVLYGPDRRTQIRPETRRALFTVYAPAGIAPQWVGDHLHSLESNVRIIVPEAKTELLEVFGAQTSEVR